MKELTTMNISIVDTSGYTCRVFDDTFCDCRNVKVFHTDVKRFCYEHDEIDCLVSPANAFGIMNGGFDAALSDILGWDFQKKVQQYIQNHFYGEQGVGTSFYIETDNPGIALIHTPTMQYPSRIKDDMIIHYCMRSTLICALEHDVNNLVVPVFGGATGGIEPETAAQRMKEGYLQIKNRTGAKYSF